jgi:ankyrin repeat protein/cytochrome c551/c552
LSKQFVVLIFAGTLAAQKVDFRRDVQPLFKTYCVGCHGPSQQMGGLRLDRKRDAMRGGSISVIGPGNSGGSRLYLKLIGSQFGAQMPPTEALRPEEIAIIKTWIDQGAEWPDDLAGDAPRVAPDPRAARMMDAIRGGDRQGFKKMLSQDREAAQLKGPGGSTPLMYAALYGDANSVKLLLDAGADPNVRNEAGATALMWATDDPEKTRLLLEARADANARSEDGRTPLLIAAMRFGSSAVVKLLLDHGANPSARSPEGQTPLSEAVRAADELSLKTLIDGGADTKGGAGPALFFALQRNCDKCANALIESVSRDALNAAARFLVPSRNDGHDARMIKTMLDRGASVDAKDVGGRTLLMLAASSEAVPVETVKTLIERGADVNARSTNGETALDFARRQGDTPIVDLLVKAGAKETGAFADPAARPKPAGSPRAAVERSIPLLQRADVSFMQKSGCVSCHNNSLTAMTIATARRNALRIDDEIAVRQLKAVGTYIESWRERVQQGIPIAGDSDTISYILLGLAAGNYPPDPATDALARFLKNRQTPDGRVRIAVHRPPLESSDAENTAVSMRAMQVYAPKAQRAEYDKAIQLATDWLVKAQSANTEDRGFQLLGLGWAGVDKAIIQKSARALLAEQHADGGWAQLPSLKSDAYATGLALVALREAGALAVGDAAYQRGIRFLIDTQFEDGSWYVKSHAIPVQPFFESGFPYGHDQWISAAGTNWATMALAPAAK